MAKELRSDQELRLLELTKHLNLDFQKLKEFTLKHGINPTIANIRLADAKETVSYPKRINKHLVRTYAGKDTYASLVTEFTNELQSIGFKLRGWTEDFVDEDTGEVVSVPKFSFD